MKNQIIICLIVTLIFSESCELEKKIVSDEMLVFESFSKAQPVWKTGSQYIMNQTLGFRGVIVAPEEKKPAFLKLTGSSLYRIFINGEFIGHGPARAGHGYYRVDQIDLTDKLRTGSNIIAIEIVGYNVNSYYLLDVPSFLQAEVILDGKVLLATLEGNAENSFDVIEVKERIQKVARFSFQRTFTESYRLTSDSYKWLTDVSALPEKVDCEIVGSKKLISRRINYSKFEVIQPDSVLFSGKVNREVKKEKYIRDRFITKISEVFKGYPENEFTRNISIDLQEMIKVQSSVVNKKYQDIRNIQLNEDEFKIVNFEYNATGFIGATIHCKKAGRFYFVFDEILSGEDINFLRIRCINAVSFDLLPGEYKLETIEPYTLKYLKVLMAGGDCEVSDIYIREYTNPDIYSAKFNCSNEDVNKIFKAGVQNFRQNVVDIPMDCPSRERAGWLCDSYFSPRAALDISGHTLVEKNFRENFLLTDGFTFLPEGMVPMCYPSDHPDGIFIPNWAIFFIIELEEYLQRSNDRDLVNRLKPTVMGIIDYFSKFLNSDGLLEGLEGWIFVEWSQANSFIQDVNYPTNMLYTAALQSAANIYDIPELAKQSRKMRSTILDQSFNGQFFVDNAIREDGRLKPTNNITEVCQYYAFYFGGASKEQFPELWKVLADDFAPGRVERNLYAEVYPANALLGKPMRLELLSKDNRIGQMLDEITAFYTPMAEQTGTLWEHNKSNGSCNHGFASHIVHVLYRDVLGISVNPVQKVITIKFSEMDLSYCKGQMPVGGQIAALEWERKNDVISYHLKIPKGYSVKIINNSGLKLKKT